MRDILNDIVKKIGGLGFVETVKVTGTDTETKLEAFDNDKTVIIKAKLNEAQPDLKGVFGISHLPLLTGLLNFTSYKTDDATFSVKHRSDSTPEEFEFRDAAGLGSNFRLMSGKLLTDQPIVTDIKWDVSFQPTKSKIQEFQALTGMYSQFDPFFSLKTVDGNLVVTIGEESSSTHYASMVLVEGVEGELKGGLLWPISQFLSIMKMADANEHTVQAASKGAMQVKINTAFASYAFVLPAHRR